jgi:tripartite-type tricarboxylate transporter receptor subunit TctC
MGFIVQSHRCGTMGLLFFTRTPAMPTHTRLTLVNRRQCLLAATLAALPALGSAQTLPTKGIKIVVPFAAGAGTDAVGRLLADKLSGVLGTPVVVDNKTGASGAIGSRYVASSPADGSTLLLVAAPFTTVPAAMPQAGYDPVRDFTPVGMVASGPLVWAVNKDVPARTLTELVALAKRQPGKLNYGSAGAGGINHLVLELLKARTGTFITHIPYRGIAPATLDLVSGEIQLITGTIPALAPFIRDGKLRALAVTSAQRSPALPGVPNMAESGLAGFDVLNYFGLMAPKATPAAVVHTLNTALAQVLALPDVKERFAKDALTAMPGTPDALMAFVEQDVNGWRKVVASQNLKLEG